jgi:HK97 family phage major capsid protein
MRALNDKATGEKRDFTAEETSTYTALEQRYTALEQRAKAEQAIAERVKATEETLARHGATGGSHARSNSDDEELRSFLRGERQSYEVKADGPVSYRDLLVSGGGGIGASAVPKTFYNRLLEYMIESSGILQTNPTVLNTDTGATIEVPVVTDHGEADVVPEGTPIPEDDPAFDVEELGAIKYGRLVQISSELAQDNAVNLQEYLARASGRALGLKFGAALVGKVVAASTAGATAADDTTFGAQNTVGAGFDSMIDLYYSVASPYRNSSSAAWLMSDLTAAAVRKLKDSDGQYIWQASVIVGQPDTILGKRVVTDPGVPSVAAAAKPIIFGDFSALFVRTVNGVRFERSDHYAFNTDMVTFRALLRGDGVVTDPNALKHLVMAGA